MLKLAHPSAISPETEALIDKGHVIGHDVKGTAARREDKREIAREEHTNHFTNRAPKKF